MDTFLKPILRLPQHHWWIDAIITDDKDTIDNALDENKNDNKSVFELVNGKFIDKDIRTGALLSNNDIPLNDRKYVINSDITYPWCLAGAYGSRCVVAKFIELGVNIHQRDNQGNIIHCIILKAYLDPRNEDCMVETF